MDLRKVDSWLDWGEMELANPPLQMEQAKAVRSSGFRV